MKIKYFIAATLAAITLNSCSDMFDDGSNRYVYNPALDEKVDSMFYINGILKSVQQAIDQNVLVNELRGDLVTPTTHASTDLQRLAAFDYADGNKYDSAYVYYRIINNCNYYIAHRDTTIATGSTQVAMKEYAEAKAIRAWAYLQLTRNYGSVPFYTKPLTNISDVESASKLELKDLTGIVGELAPDLEQYINLPVPNWGEYPAGTNDHGLTKTVQTSQMMIPVRLILADLYLETGNYDKAAEHYFSYLKTNKLQLRNFRGDDTDYPNQEDIPNSLRNGQDFFISNGNWENLYKSDVETCTYVPMATNKLRGETTALPGLFGYNYYTAADGKTYSEEPALTASESYKKLSDSQNYYYRIGSGTNWVYMYQPIGDMRYYESYNQYKTTTQVDPIKIFMKYYNANITLYRNAGIYLKLAEAINRMGHPDVAFALLKDGWNHKLEQDTTYITQEGIEFLKTKVPFLTAENRVVFNDESEDNEWSEGNSAIHARGAGLVQGNGSLYKYRTEIDKKLESLGKSYPANAGHNDSIAVKMDAVEDLLCDEMALELAFEGSRFGDLCRIARHKNASNPWGSNYGSLWLRDKLSFKNPVLDLSNPENWFMPFK